jgi:hypothetical protein
MVSWPLAAHETMKTLKEIIVERKCRKGTPAGTTKRGAYWLACEPITTRASGSDGVGQNPPRVIYELHLRHFRSGEVRAVIHRNVWHQSGSQSAVGQDWADANAVVDCSTIEEVVVALKGISLNDSPVVEDYLISREIAKRLRELGLPDSAPAPDEV